MYYIISCKAVFGISKIQFWKQFTTASTQWLPDSSCIRYIKDTILKAIYNIILILMQSCEAVFGISKIQFWKQFTTDGSPGNFTSMLYSVYQRYNFESNLQQSRTYTRQRLSCIRYIKDTILKAIYNWLRLCWPWHFAVFGISKIQFWKQFTTAVARNTYIICCIRYIKDTILKAIYNVLVSSPTRVRAVFDMSKI